MEDPSDLQLLRSRLVVSALAERRRIERALHDGLQQDLIGLSVRLQLLRDVVAGSRADAVAQLDEVRDEVKSALDRLRALANEIYPAILDARGLSDALRQAAAASEAGARVEAAEIGRYPAEVEAAVFFLWRAVLDGEPGSSGGRTIRVEEQDEALHVEISTGRKADLTAMRDLVEGAGGELAVESQPGGDRVRARFPLG